jgi:type I restriction enzyme S subunit
VPEGWTRTTLGRIHIDRSGSVDPSKRLEERFELYSVPSWDTGEPVILEGKEIGSNKLRVHPNVVLLNGYPSIRSVGFTNPIWPITCSKAAFETF